MNANYVVNANYTPFNITHGYILGLCNFTYPQYNKYNTSSPWWHYIICIVSSGLISVWLSLHKCLSESTDTTVSITIILEDQIAHCFVSEPCVVSSQWSQLNKRSRLYLCWHIQNSYDFVLWMISGKCPLLWTYAFVLASLQSVNDKST